MPSLLDDLRGGDPEARASALEHAILQGLSLRPDDALVPRLARAYGELSVALLAAEEQGTTPSGLWGEGDGASARRAVWGLIYGARTFELGLRFWAAFGKPGRCVELGSGWGPFGLAAAVAASARVELVDASAEALQLGSRIFGAAGLDTPACAAGEVTPERVPRGTELVALPFSLGELMRVHPDPTEHGARFLQACVERLAPDGVLLAIEAGTRISARRLQAVRDRLVEAGAAVLGPCKGHMACPSLLEPADWCHFTWPAAPGPLARRIADAAGRRWQEVHFSWLALRRGPRIKHAPGDLRVFDVRTAGRGKVELRGCGAAGFVRLTALERNEEAVAALRSLGPSAEVTLDLEHVQRKGDGLRVVSSNALTRSTAL
jgi:hypothetical protein